ncbi:WD repeat-containing protein 55-like isoform X2 [Lytechinus variegatus]|uniref:WD repeat-containing protein 55-like isoform X2 n=1 Tax=Lytechinus variegatus TaxID=7654 RepID=UPI001BB1191C|nr:WD repeat-containing protein 55-like isoform X2 [Lytechinus variegatus]XP_041477431.1 WD repeat-containing protein 55-like isoform X2 [Lytechinus variegatus]
MSSEDQDVSGDSDLDSEKKSSLDEGEDEMENQAGPSTSNGANFKNPDASAKDESSEGSGDDDSDDDDDDDDSDDSEDSDESDDGEEERDDENRFLPEVKLPKTITCDESVMSLQFHPKGNMLAAGLIDGSITLYSYSAEEPNEELMFEEVHKKACRAIAFSEDGKSVFSVSKDKSISKLDVATASVELSLEKAHEDPIYCLAVVDENLVATGDDDGHLKVWDLRTQKAIMEMKENEEFISSLIVGKDKKILLSTSGDGTLCAFNVRRRRFDLQSEHVNSELLCANIIKKGQKVVCGASDGALNIFNWNEFGNISDRFPGHSSSIDCCVPVTENIICTGCIDGTIRAVHMLPNRFLGIVGEHEELPVESMTVSFDSKYLASCALEDKIRFWGVEHLQKTNVDPRGKAGKNDASKRLTGSGKEDNFFADL